MTATFERITTSELVIQRTAESHATVDIAGDHLQHAWGLVI